MTINVMTFNIRCDNSIDGKNSFSGRRRLVKKMLLRETPDIIGFQEVLPHVKKWLTKKLHDYEFIGIGRNADFSGEAVPIAYKKEKFELLSYRQFWLSDTPSVPGSRFENSDQSKYPRICVIATFFHKPDGKVFTFANTHLDHKGNRAKADASTLIVSELAKDGLPFILTGDFNARPNDEPIKLILENPSIVDITKSLGKNYATFHNYGKVIKDYKIDYIFSNFGSTASNLKVHTDEKRGIYLSDHYPISVSIDL